MTMSWQYCVVPDETLDVTVRLLIVKLRESLWDSLRHFSYNS